MYGHPSEGTHCLSGLQTIDLYFYNTSSTNKGSTSFLYTYNGLNITNIVDNYIYEC